MKHFIYIFFLIPSLTFGQVKLDNLTKRNGLSYEKDATVPFTGKAFAYFPGGDVQTVLEYKDGIPHGEIKSWSKKDVKQVEGFLDHGKRTGTWKLYFESGKLKKQSTFQNDIENGEEIFWFENGNMQKKGSYTNGKLNGKYEWYYENGQKKQEGFFVNGKEDGTWGEWFDNGKQKMVGHFTNLEKNGNWTWWDENGKITTSKKYVAGLVTVDKDNFDTYLEKMEFFLSKRNYKESLKNVESAEATITNKTESNPIFMGVILYHSKCYSYFSHYKQAEKVLLDAMGLTDNQSQTILTSHVEKSPEKINQAIEEITKKDKSTFQITNHITLSLCYNIIGDTVSLKKEQQLLMEKGQMQDWIIKISLELYKLAGARFNNYAALEDINNTITKKGLTEQLELDKAQYLLRTEKFEEAQTIVDKYLKANDKNLTALLLKADLEMAYGNIDKMKFYSDKALAIDPKAFSNPKN
jgi:antitoxin component YwqK of YwqJK toxin-antitoxin module